MDSIRQSGGSGTIFNPNATPAPTAASGRGDASHGAPGVPQGDRTTFSPREHEADRGGIPNFAAAYGDNQGTNGAGQGGNGQTNGASQGQPGLTQDANGRNLSPTEIAGRQKDQETVQHVCGGGCGCIQMNPGGGVDPIKTLQRRDEEVRQHEQEHLQEAGEHARGGPKFETHTASDGRSYVTGGKVEVDLSETNDPKKTADKMAKIRKAALAPRTPSTQDRTVEAEAASKESSARSEMNRRDQENGRKPGDPGSLSGPPGSQPIAA